MARIRENQHCLFFLVEVEVPESDSSFDACHIKIENTLTKNENLNFPLRYKNVNRLD